jgi:hypothetical protein
MSQTLKSIASINVGVNNVQSTATGISVTGDLEIADKIVHVGDTNTAIRFPTNDTVTVETSGSERMRIDSSGNVGVGTATPANKLDVFGDVPLACLFTATTSGTTMDVTVVTSGALAVGQTVSDGAVTARITALDTGTGGVGTYTLNRDITGTSPFVAFLPQPNTLRIGNSSATYERSVPNGSIEFYGSSTTASPRAVIRSSNPSGTNTNVSTNLDFMVGNAGGPAGTGGPQDPVLRLTSTNVFTSRSLILGSTSLIPANSANGLPGLNFQGRVSLAPSSGNQLATMFFSGAYIDSGTTYDPGFYGQIGYVVDGSYTLGQLPSAFTIHTRNAAGTTAERLRIDKDGNVGIGTTVLDWSTSRRAISLAGGATVSVFNHASFTGETLYNAYVGPTGFYTYQVDGPAARVDFNGISSGVSWSVAPSGVTGNNITFSQVMTLLPSGNLGIGTNSPATALDVNGTVTATGWSGGGIVTQTAAQTLTNKTLTDPAIIGTITEDIFTITDGAAFEIDPGNGSVQLITLDANRTPKATNMVAGEAITLMVDDGSAYALTWTDATFGGSGVVWKTDGGVAPTLNTSGYTAIVLWKVSTQVYGARVGDA